MGKIFPTDVKPLTQEEIAAQTTELIQRIEAAHKAAGESNILFGNSKVKIGTQHAEGFDPNKVAQLLLETEHPEALRKHFKDALESIREGNSYRFE